MNTGSTTFDNCSKQVAERLGLSWSGVKSRVQRGRQKLKEMLTECCHFDFDRRGRVIDYQAKPGCCDDQSGTGTAC